MNQLNNHDLSINDQPAKLEVNYGFYIRLGWGVLILGLGGFLLWASLAPLDKGVPMIGTVSVASNKKAIQHEVGGTVDEIFVKDGDVVQAGDLLLRMNNVRAEAEAESLRVQYITARAIQSRLLAEQKGTKVNVPNEFENHLKDPRVMNSIAMQEQIAKSRKASLKSEQMVINQSIKGLYAQVAGLKQSVVSKQQQKKLLLEQINNVRELASNGFYPSNQVLTYEQQLAELESELSSDTGAIGRYEAQVAELKMQKIQKNREYQKEVNTQLSEAQKQADALNSQLKSLDRDVSNVDVKAPVTGTVVGLSVFTSGAVVSPGFTLMDIVPIEDNLVVEGRLPVHMIDKVHINLPVNLLFTAFNQNKTPNIPGVVTNVSADRYEDDRTGEPYYKVIAKVAPEGAELVSDLKVLPGMPVDMFVKTGERTMMNYLLKPIADHLKLSMSEE